MNASSRTVSSIDIRDLTIISLFIKFLVMNQINSSLFSHDLDILLENSVTNLSSYLFSDPEFSEFEDKLIKEVIMDLALECKMRYSTFAFEFHLLTGKRSEWMKFANNNIQQIYLALVNTYLRFIPVFCEKFPKLVIMNSCSGDLLRCCYVIKVQPPGRKEECMDLNIFLDRPVLNRDSWYLVSTEWFKEWKKYVYEEGQFPGPIDNSSLMEGFCIKPYLSHIIDYNLIPEEKYQFLLSWYGLAQSNIVIRRIAVSMSSITQQSIIEIYPVKLMCSILGRETWINIHVSRSETVYDLLERSKLALQLVSIPNRSILVYKRTYKGNELLSDLDKQLEEFKLFSVQEICIELQV